MKRKLSKNGGALDLAIIGSGPAALTATIYAARAGFNVQVSEKAKIGAAAALEIVNYLKNNLFDLKLML